MKYGDRPGEQRPQPPEQLPSYQEGGTVPQDQTAQLDEGEYVLDPKDAALWRQAENQVRHEYNVGPNEMQAEGVDVPTMQRGGMTVSFGGEKAIPNPKDIKPMLDTDQPKPDLDYKLQGGAMNTDNAPLAPPPMNIKPAGVPKADQISTLSSAGAPRMNYTPLAPAEPPLEKGTGAMEQRPPEQDMLDQIDKNKIAAAQKGDLVGLGMANIHERMVRASQAAELPKPTPPTAEENLKNQRMQLHEKMINAPTEQERFQAEKDLAELNRRSPWGSEGNHPGVMGKIGHVLSRVGQAALLPTAPYLATAIPGSQAQLAAQATRGEAGVEGAQKKQMTQADIVAKEAAPEIKEQQLALAQQKVDEVARQAGWKKNAITGQYDIPLSYEEMSPLQQANYDKIQSLTTLQEAKGHEQEAKAVLERYKADPNSPTNQAALAKIQEEAKRTAVAAGKLGLDQKRFVADYYGLDENGQPIPGVPLTSEGKPAAGVKLASHDQAGRVFDKYSPQIDKASQPFVAAYQRSGLLSKNLDAKTKQADALVAPELLSIAAGGAGSGLRMNEAEINRVIGGRSVWDALVARANQIKESGGTFDDAQREQLKMIATYINARNAAEVRVFNMGREAMLAAKDDANKVRQVYEHMQEVSGDLAGKGLVAPGGKAEVGDYVIHGNQIVKVTSVKDGKTLGEVVAF